LLTSWFIGSWEAVLRAIKPIFYTALSDLLVAQVVMSLARA
jgi:hypothetical protein